VDYDLFKLNKSTKGNLARVPLTNFTQSREEDFMKPSWTGDVVAKLHIHDITQRQLAAHMGISFRYLCGILAGKLTPPNAEQRIITALNELIEERDNA
jgi:hypothetical protein